MFKQMLLLSSDLWAKIDRTPMFSYWSLVSFQINFKLTQRKLYSFLSIYYYRFILYAVNNAERVRVDRGKIPSSVLFLADFNRSFGVHVQ